MIPYSRQNINQKDILEVNKVLRSNFLTQGNNVMRFEKIAAIYNQRLSSAKFISAKKLTFCNSAAGAKFITKQALLLYYSESFSFNEIQ